MSGLFLSAAEPSRQGMTPSALVIFLKDYSYSATEYARTA